MNQKSEKVLAGFLNLSSTEQKALIQEIQKYLEASEEKQRELKESIAKVYTGPVNVYGCPCCGK